MDLSGYGTQAGLRAWSLDRRIKTLDAATAENLLERGRNLITTHGGSLDSSKEDFARLITDAVYYAAEFSYVIGLNIGSIILPFRMERIGGYQYDKGARGNDASTLIQEHPILWPLLVYLQDRRGPMIRSRRVFHEPPVNPETGIIDVVRSSNDARAARWLTADGINSDTEEFNKIVYGDY